MHWSKGIPQNPLLNGYLCVRLVDIMTATDQKVVSPVNVQARKDLDIKSGDTVRVHQKIQEKGKTRIQIFEGLVLARKHGSEAGATFTVRKVMGGVGVEKIYPLYTPLIDKIEIVRRAKVRRAKLYYIREKAAREIRRQMRRMKLVNLSTGSDMQAVKDAEKAEEEAEAAKKQETANQVEEEAKEAAAKAEETPAEEPKTEEAPAEEVKEEDPSEEKPAE